jgi:cysteine desulfurase
MDPSSKYDLFMNRIYLDHNATTPVYPEVIETMMESLHRQNGNPSSLHHFGQDAKCLLERAREQVAHLFCAHSDEVIFCSSGTEANNLALIGAARANASRGRHILISSIEHPSVLQPADWLQSQGYCVELLPCDSQGVLDLAMLQASLRPDTILISCMIANNDTGVWQPIDQISALAREKGILLHADGVAAAGKMEVSVKEIPVDLLSVSSHKIHGPAGAAALYLRHNTRIESISWGGNQERKLRPGTENLIGILGFGKACEITQSRLPSNIRSLQALQAKLERGIKQIPRSVVFGQSAERLCNTTYAGFAEVENDLLAIHLDLHGIAVSTGAACHASEREPSHVLLAMGLDPQTARSGIRFSLGEANTAEEIDQVLQILPTLVERLRKQSSGLR